jgi:hypothetical protein
MEIRLSFEERGRNWRQNSLPAGFDLLALIRLWQLIASERSKRVDFRNRNRIPDVFQSLLGSHKVDVRESGQVFQKPAVNLDRLSLILLCLV